MARIASRYEERHASLVLPLIGVAIAVLALVVTAFSTSASDDPPLWILAFILAVAFGLLLAFSALTVTVGGSILEWHFRFGFWRKRILLADIVSVAPRSLPLWYGLGVRRTPEGWYYAVRGRGAVAVETRGGKKVLIGSPTPERLAEAIRQRLPQSSGPIIDVRRN
ncbi:MAG: hypothetical protein IT534_03050 [Bauldia sp.]|nr:hypothetical protein [Bauldia sp.]